MLGELILTPRQGRVPGGLVVQALFDLALQVLCPEAHTEGLALQHKAAVHQHPEGVPGRVAHGKHQCLTGEGPSGGKDAGQPSVLLLKTGEGRVEVHLAAQSFDLPADGGDNAPEQVGAHMGLLLPGDLRRGTVLQKHLGDKAAELIPDAGGQLAIRKGARAALAKLDVGIGVQLTSGREVLHRLHTLVQRGAALQHDGLVALPGQQQRRKQTRRAQPADHRPVGQALGAVLNAEIRFAADSNAGRGPCIRRFLTLVLERYRYGIHQLWLPVAGIHRQPGHAQMGRLAAGDARQMQRFLECLRLPGRERQADISY